MTHGRNILAAVISGFAGILFLISGTHGPTRTYEFILQELPLYVSDVLILSIARTIALVLISISLLGGFVLLGSAYLLFRDHGRIGKLAISLGTGAGIPWLIFLLLTLATAKDASAVLAQYSTLGWIGVIAALVARYTAK